MHAAAAEPGGGGGGVGCSVGGVEQDSLLLVYAAAGMYVCMYV